MSGERMTGLLLGTAVGDSLGLPRQGLSPARAARRYPGPLRQRLLFGRGMLSDDTEHACMTAQALLIAGDDPDRFARVLAGKLRWWLAGLPAAIGWGTLRALVRSCAGYGPARSGVMSAGNGAAMRAPVIGAWVADLARLPAFVDASTLITHRDPRARAGALAIAIAAHHAVRSARIVPEIVLRDIRARISDPELEAALVHVETALARDAPATEVAATLGLARGITGYIHHTVPICLYAWLRSPTDVRRVLTEVIELGGDADTTGAIAGALVGASAGAAAIPPVWLAITDYPRSLGWIRALAARLATRGAPLPLVWPAVVLRNAVFTLIATATALRRALPPY